MVMIPFAIREPFLRLFLSTLGFESTDSQHDLGRLGHSSPDTVLCLSRYLPSYVTHDVTHVSMPTGISVEAVSSVLGLAWVPDHVLPGGLPDSRLHAFSPTWSH